MTRNPSTIPAVLLGGVSLRFKLPSSLFVFTGGRFALAVGRSLGLRAVLRAFRAAEAGAGGFGRAGGRADFCAESAEAEPDLAGTEGLARVGPWVPGAAQVVDEVAGEA